MCNSLVLFFVLCSLLCCLYCPQACDDLSKWTVLLGSSLVCGPRIENISFIIEATGHRVGYHSPHTSNQKVGTTPCLTCHFPKAIINSEKLALSRDIFALIFPTPNFIIVNVSFYLLYKCFVLSIVELRI